jgi:3-methyladenine DNA glycosylase AlkD
MEDILKEIREELTFNSDASIRRSGEKFFKEPVKMYGLRSALVSEISKTHFKTLGDKSKENIFKLCEQLWQSGIIEESFVACNWSFGVRKQYEKPDIKVFSEWISKYVSNWATCDTLCNHSVGTLIELYPELIIELKKWAHEDNRWMKRAAAVSLIIPARKGKFREDIFEIADILHADKDDMVQKGYGWMLKACSQSYVDEVFSYVMDRKHTMPRTAFRYAIEKMPDEYKRIAMAK